MTHAASVPAENALAAAILEVNHHLHSKPPDYDTALQCMKAIENMELLPWSGESHELDSHVVSTAFAKAFGLYVYHGHLQGMGACSWVKTQNGKILYDIWAPQGYIRGPIIIIIGLARRHPPYKEEESSHYERLTASPKFKDGVKQVLRVLRPIAESCNTVPLKTVAR